MNHISFTPENLERIHPALAHWGWHLVEARDDWFQDDQKIRAFYVIDANGAVVEPYFDLNALAMDLRVLGEVETIECCDMLLAVPGRATEAAVATDPLAAEVAALTAAIGDTNPIAGGQAGRKEDVHRAGLVDEEGRRWVSWHHQAKVPYTW